MSLSNRFKQSYTILQGKNVYVANPKSKYVMDPLFKIFTIKSEYDKFLQSLADSCPKSLVKFFNMFKQSILRLVIPVYKQEGDPIYSLTDNMVIVHLYKDDSPQTKLKEICGGIIVRAIVDNVKDNQLTPYTVPFSILYAKALLKVFPRPIDINEAYPDLVRIILAWLLKLQGVLRTSTLSSACSQADVPFVSKQDVQELYDKVAQTNKVYDALDLFARQHHVDPANMIMVLVKRYSLDFTLGLENLYHALYMVSIAHILYFPPELYFLTKSNEEMLNRVFKSVLPLLNRYKS